MLQMANRFAQLATTGKWARTIDVRHEGEAVDIEVKHYIKVITPSGGTLPMTGERFKQYVALGLSLREDKDE